MAYQSFSSTVHVLISRPAPKAREKRPGDEVAAWEARAKKDRGTGFSVLGARETKQEPKNESGGGGGGGREREGRKEKLSEKPFDFENLRSPANATPDWLG